MASSDSASEAVTSIRNGAWRMLQIRSLHPYHLMSVPIRHRDCTSIRMFSTALPRASWSEHKSTSSDYRKNQKAPSRLQKQHSFPASSNSSPLVNIDCLITDEMFPTLTSIEAGMRSFLRTASTVGKGPSDTSMNVKLNYVNVIRLWSLAQKRTIQRNSPIFVSILSHVVTAYHALAAHRLALAVFTAFPTDAPHGWTAVALGRILASARALGEVEIYETAMDFLERQHPPARPPYTPLELQAKSHTPGFEQWRTEGERLEGLLSTAVRRWDLATVESAIQRLSTIGWPLSHDTFRVLAESCMARHQWNKAASALRSLVRLRQLVHSKDQKKVASSSDASNSCASYPMGTDLSHFPSSESDDSDYYVGSDPNPLDAEGCYAAGAENSWSHDGISYGSEHDEYCDDQRRVHSQMDVTGLGTPVNDIYNTMHDPNSWYDISYLQAEDLLASLSCKNRRNSPISVEKSASYDLRLALTLASDAVAHGDKVSAAMAYYVARQLTDHALQVQAVSRSASSDSSKEKGTQSPTPVTESAVSRRLFEEKDLGELLQLAAGAGAVSLAEAVAVDILNVLAPDHSMAYQEGTSDSTTSSSPPRHIPPSLRFSSPHHATSWVLHQLVEASTNGNDLQGACRAVALLSLLDKEYIQTHGAINGKDTRHKGISSPYAVSHATRTALSNALTTLSTRILAWEKHLQQQDLPAGGLDPLQSQFETGDNVDAGDATFSDIDEYSAHQDGRIPYGGDTGSTDSDMEALYHCSYESEHGDQYHPPEDIATGADVSAFSGVHTHSDSLLRPSFEILANIVFSQEPGTSASELAASTSSSGADRYRSKKDSSSRWDHNNTNYLSTEDQELAISALVAGYSSSSFLVRLAALGTTEATAILPSWKSFYATAAKEAEATVFPPPVYPPSCPPHVMSMSSLPTLSYFLTQQHRGPSVVLPEGSFRLFETLRQSLTHTPLTLQFNAYAAATTDSLGNATGYGGFHEEATLSLQSGLPSTYQFAKVEVEFPAPLLSICLLALARGRIRIMAPPLLEFAINKLSIVPEADAFAAVIDSFASNSRVAIDVTAAEETLKSMKSMGVPLNGNVYASYSNLLLRARRYQQAFNVLDSAIASGQNPPLWAFERLLRGIYEATETAQRRKMRSSSKNYDEMKSSSSDPHNIPSIESILKMMKLAG